MRAQAQLVVIHTMTSTTARRCNIITTTTIEERVVPEFHKSSRQSKTELSYLALGFPESLRKCSLSPRYKLHHENSDYSA